jgi:fucose 4-O-acetylase-like acetyltransferase
VITTKLTLTKVPFVLLVLSAFAVVVGITVAVVLARIPAFDFVRSLGSRTLPIYLVHTFPMTALAAILVAFDGHQPVVVATLLPLLLCAGSIAVALVLHWRFHTLPGVFTVPVKSWVIVRPRTAISTNAQR